MVIFKNCYQFLDTDPLEVVSMSPSLKSDQACDSFLTLTVWAVTPCDFQSEVLREHAASAWLAGTLSCQGPVSLERPLASTLGYCPA